MRGSSASASAELVTSAPAASQTSAIALMKEIFVARKAFAADLDQLGGRQVGDDHRHARVEQRRVDLAQHLLGAPSEATPKTSRSGRSVSSTA